MPRNEVGTLRRSAVVSTFGPGAIVDMRAERGAPVSVVLAGLEQWDEKAPPAGLANPQTINEPRLEKFLNVSGFRLPPVQPEGSGGTKLTIVGVRFPRWLLCSGCHRLKPASRWGHQPGEAARRCPSCSASAPGQKPRHVVPVRFIMACQAGHLDEFPWDLWVAHKPGCPESSLRLQTTRAGLAGLLLQCEACGARKTMDGVFSPKVFAGRLTCRGLRPWLRATPETCSRIPIVLQRGASNLYFPVQHSALDIPPWSDSLQQAIGIYWEPIRNVPDPQQRALFIRTLATSNLRPLLAALRLTPDSLVERIEDRLRALAAADADMLRTDEYLQFTAQTSSEPDPDSQFEIRPVDVPDALRPWFGGFVQAHRLREVRTVSAFTRIMPAAASPSPGSPVPAAISLTRLGWLPAIEVRGEGVFFRLDESRVRAWESAPATVDRWRSLTAHLPKEDAPPARFILVHTLAHVIMRQLALDCGYSAPSLRERLYAATGQAEMAGVLVYTATPDADGTLGGLVRQGEASRLETLLPAALRAVEWCSSDPLCMAGAHSRAETANGAACHACLLAPETSCEQFNRFLDRALLFGLPGLPELGFFRELMV